MPRRLSFQLACLLFACGLAARAHAAELGDVKVNSFVGQHLSADIELTSLDDPAAQVQVRLASLDVYRGANLDMPPVLASVNLRVMRRDGKQFLHVTSTRPVDADHLHLYLELTDGNRRGVRLATLWFAPDPTPPAPPERVAIPMTSPAAAATPAAARKSSPIRPLPQSPVPKARTVAPPGTPPSKVTSDADARPQKVEPMPAKPAASTEPAAKPAASTEPAATPAASTEPAATPAATTAPAAKPAVTPAQAAKPAALTEPIAKAAPSSGPAAKAAPSSEPIAKQVPAADPPSKRPASAEPPVPPLPWAAGQPARPAPLKLAKAPPAPACRKQTSAAESTCIALDSKNAELRAEIGKLEARVNSLLAKENSRQPEVSKPAPQQTVLPVPQKPERPALEESPGQAASGKVKPMQSRLAPKPAALPHKPVAAKAGEATPGMPWGWIGGAGVAVFAAIGALQFWRHRRKRPKSATVHAPLPDDEAGQVEPTLG
ncbi:MAG: FimV/HubP-related protein [Telluria sp.]